MDQSLREECEAPALPADPVTPTDALQFSFKVAAFGKCERARANGLLAVIEANNEAAR